MAVTKQNYLSRPGTRENKFDFIMSGAVLLKQISADKTDEF